MKSSKVNFLRFMPFWVALVWSLLNYSIGGVDARREIRWDLLKRSLCITTHCKNVSFLISPERPLYTACHTGCSKCGRTKQQNHRATSQYSSSYHDHTMIIVHIQIIRPGPVDRASGLIRRCSCAPEVLNYLENLFYSFPEKFFWIPPLNSAKL